MSDYFTEDEIERLRSDAEAAANEGQGDSSSGVGGQPKNMVPCQDRYKEQYGVMVICASEEDQKKTFERLQEEGYNCKVVVT